MSQNTHSGEAVIRKAFYRSLLTLVTALIAGYAIYHFSHQESAPGPVQQQAVKGPVIEQQAAIKMPEVRFRDITRDAGIDFVHTNGA